MSTLLVSVGACEVASSATDAGAAARDAGADAVAVDAAMEAEGDAAPELGGLLCTGRPVPPGLPCVAQDIGAIGPCDGHGAVAFDGLQCLVVRGPECSSAGRGAFDSIEECGVSCAAVGQCPPGDTLIVSPPEGGRFPESCTDAPAECLWMRVDVRPPASCVVWGVFSRPAVESRQLPFPEQWEVLWSLTMAPQYIGRTYCDQGL